MTSPWRVPFDYIPRGLLCNGRWYPILKMEWIEASGLIPFIQDHLWQSATLARLAKEFAALMQELSQRGIAHGDLQHGNLLVTVTGTLKLIDYDGMYVPGLEDLGGRVSSAIRIISSRSHEFRTGDRKVWTASRPGSFIVPS